MEKFIVYDMPGYNDTANDDPKLFDELARWRADSHTKGVHLNGVVLMQPITDVRVREPEQALIRLFEKTIGEHLSKQVTIVSTMWDQVTPEFEQRSEDNRARGEKGVWRNLLTAGADVLRYEHDEVSALAVLRHFLPADRFLP